MAVGLQLDISPSIQSAKAWSLFCAVGLHLLLLSLGFIPLFPPPKDPDIQRVILIDPAELQPAIKQALSRPAPPREERVRKSIPEPSKEEILRRDRRVAENSGLVKLLKQAHAKGVSDPILSNPEAEELLAADAPSDNSNTAASGNTLSEIRGRPSRGIGSASAKIARSGVDVAMAGRRTVMIENPLKTDSSAPVVGGRSLEEIKKVLDQGKGAIEILYKQVLSEQPTLEGTITLEFTIAADGSVPSCRAVSATLRHENFEDSLIRRIRHLKFRPIPEGEVTITFPFVFYPGG